LARSPVGGNPRRRYGREVSAVAQGDRYLWFRQRVEMSDYALVVSDSEISRYTMMAERAKAFAAYLWDRVGIVTGATIADVGGGPAAGPHSVVLLRAEGTCAS
jgi:hypothetical protein